ncbi:hypothetical protein L1049_021869 [Liquidambar formosana]|uniref:Protein FAR1-RELATED SEQUENCE n=1 Tax=Liquidambar formosana TaxID=63359 RepID=A0AAP0RBR1_LIQFO
MKAMPGGPPKMIITDQDPAMEIAIKNVLPNTTHRFCIWHILKKFSKKLDYATYDQHYQSFRNCIWDSENPQEFEARWVDLIEKIELQGHELWESMKCGGIVKVDNEIQTIYEVQRHVLDDGRNRQKQNAEKELPDRLRVIVEDKKPDIVSCSFDMAVVSVEGTELPKGELMSIQCRMKLQSIADGSNNLGIGTRSATITSPPVLLEPNKVRAKGSVGALEYLWLWEDLCSICNIVGGNGGLGAGLIVVKGGDVYNCLHFDGSING